MLKYQRGELMCKEKTKNWRTMAFAFGALLLLPLYVSTAFAYSSGGVTSTLDCRSCHGFENLTTVMILGPDSVVHDSVNTYEIEISGAGPGVIGGFDVAAAFGVLGLIDPGTEGTQLVTDSTSGLGEVTHDGAKAFSGGTVSWLFSWTAPSELGSYDLFAQAVNANGAMGNNGDFTGMTTFTVQVAAIPLPAAAYLFGSALGLLGWFRFRNRRHQTA
jgi:hypothetical protein